ncbi:YybH family protein [Pseudoneobacillus sp. C159]
MSVEFPTVLDVLQNYKTAVYEKDVEKFLSSYHSEIHIFDCWDCWEYNGISQWKEMVTDWFNGLRQDGVYLNVELDNLVVEENSSLAIVYGTVKYAAHIQSGEKLRQTANRFTFTLKKEQASWKIIHEHSSLPTNLT